MRRLFRLEPNRAQIAREVDQEIQAHLDLRTEKLIAQGLTPEAARAEALRQFGDLTGVRDSCVSLDQERERSMRRGRRLDEFKQDLVYAVRTLRRNPVFALTVVSILALGIGANTAIFTLIDAVLFRKLPVPQADQLIAIGDPTRVNSLSTSALVRTDLISYPLYRELRNQSQTLTGLAASGRGGRLDVFVDQAGDEPERPRARFVSTNYFSVLQVPALMGRTFDQTETAAPEIVISHGYWNRRLGGDSRVIGRTLLVQGQQLTIIGVTPAWFRGDVVEQSIDFWIPLPLQPVLDPHRPWLDDWEVQWLLLLGRTRAGITQAEVRAEMETLIRNQIETLSPTPERAAAGRRQKVYVASGARGFSWARASFKGPLFTLMAGVGLLLLMICANIANLLLARAIARGREIGVRLALGAGRMRLVRQLLTESLVLALLSAAGGLLFSYWASRMLLVLAADRSPAIPIDTSLSLPVLGFTLALSVLSLALFGFAPALRASRIDLATTMRTHARAVTGAGGRGRLAGGRILIAVQVALSLVLLLGAALLARSLRQLESVDPGLDRDHLLIVGVGARERGYQGERLDGLARELNERLSALDGVAAVSFSENGIFSGTESRATFTVPGFVARSEDDSSAYYDTVGPGYVRAIDGRLLEGREFTSEDRWGSHPVILVNQTMARFYWPRGAIGQTIRIDSVTAEVIGVLADVKDHALDAMPVRRFYFAYLQRATEEPGSLRFTVRTAGDPALLSTAARRAVQTVDPSLRIYGIDPVAVLMRDSIAQERMLARLATGFGALAILLAAIGLYGLMTYAMTRRTGEIGLRMALGAKGIDVAGMVLKEALRLVGLGIALGVPLAWGAGRLLDDQLYEVPAGDPISIAIALSVLTATAVLAALLPALRAARVDPLEALREE